MSRFLGTGRGLLAAQCLIFCQISLSCFNPFAPKLNKQSDFSNVITEQKTPEEVLQNFQYAYTFKDSLLYSDILDKSFVFEFFDSDLDPTGGFRTWGRDVDLQTTGSLFRNFDVIELKWFNTLFSESDGELERRFVRFTLNLFGQDLNFILAGTAIFTFKQEPTDSKWRIVRWKDESDF